MTIGTSQLGGGTFGGGGIFGGTAAQLLAFLDETGSNPLPAGIYVQIYAGSIDGLLGAPPIAAGWTQPGGLCNVPVQPGNLITCVFSLSSQAPPNPVEITPDGNGPVYTVTVAPYRSPSLSDSGYAALLTSKLPRGWFSGAALADEPGDGSPSGIAYAIAYAIGAALAALDQGQTQVNLGRARLGPSVGADIDSWSTDMVGPTFGRYPQESDALFISRNMLMVSRPRCSINALQKFVTQFYASILAGWNVTGSEALGFDTAGGFEVSGAFNNPPAPSVPKNPPPVTVWDGMTQPALAAALGVTPLQFVIMVGLFSTSLVEQLGFNVAGALGGGPHGASPGSGGFSNEVTNDTLPSPTRQAPDPRLGTMINLITKGTGTVPLYLIGQL